MTKAQANSIIFLLIFIVAIEFCIWLLLVIEAAKHG